MSLDRSVEAVFAHLREYLAARSRIVYRLNPKSHTVLPAIVQTQLDSLGIVLSRAKAWGTEKHRIIDILLGEDELKRKAVLSTSDNNSILVDVLNTGGDKGKKMAEFLINDQRTHLTHVDASIEKLVLLVQHYMWWDLPDAAELVHFDDKCRTINYVLSGQISEELKAHFRFAHRIAADVPLTPEQMLQAEIKSLEASIQRFFLRRNEEEPYVYIIRRDTETLTTLDTKIMQLSAHLRTVQTASDANTPLEQGLIEHFAKQFHCDAAEVTNERVLEHEGKVIAELKSQILRDLATGHEGEGVNMKHQQALVLKQRFEAERAAVDNYLKNSAAAAAAAAPSGSLPAAPAS